jgi:teichuronic acid biosynthesis glycosyltransferase TuaC
MPSPVPMPPYRGANAPLRVLAVIPGAEEGPSFIFAKRQMADVRELGVDVRCFWLGERTSPRGLAIEWARLRRTIAGMDPDVVHAHYGTVTALVAALASRRPFVITYRGSDLNGTPAVSRVRAQAGIALSQLAALRANAIICVSEQVRGRLWWRGGGAEVLPSGVDAAVFQPRPRSEARAALGWNDAERVVLFNGSRHTKGKRLDLAEAAAAVAARLVPGARLEVLDGAVPADRIATYMNAADCLLMTSDREGSPNVVKEALACDLPVVSVDVGDVRERIAGVTPGGIVERDPERLGAALAAILGDPRRSDGHMAIDGIRTRRIAERIVAIYRRVARRPGAGTP